MSNDYLIDLHAFIGMRLEDTDRPMSYTLGRFMRRHYRCPVDHVHRLARGMVTVTSR